MTIQTNGAKSQIYTLSVNNQKILETNQPTPRNQHSQHMVSRCIRYITIHSKHKQSISLTLTNTGPYYINGMLPWPGLNSRYTSNTVYYLV